MYILDSFYKPVKASYGDIIKKTQFADWAPLLFLHRFQVIDNGIFRHIQVATTFSGIGSEPNFEITSDQPFMYDEKPSQLAFVDTIEEAFILHSEIIRNVLNNPNFREHKLGTIVFLNKTMYNRFTVKI